MARAQFVVFTYAHPGRESDLAQWYTDQHIPDLLRIPGIEAARRFDLEAVKLPPGIAIPTSLTVYDFDGDIPAIQAELAARQGTPEMVWTDALDSSRTIALLAHPKN